MRSPLMTDTNMIREIKAKLSKLNQGRLLNIKQPAIKFESTIMKQNAMNSNTRHLFKKHNSINISKREYKQEYF